MGFLSRFSRRKSGQDAMKAITTLADMGFLGGVTTLPEADMTTLAEAERKKRGLLPPPNLAISYKCECGINHNVDLKSFNIFGGDEVTCAKCFAVCFIPPEILDHTEYDPRFKGATLRGDWQSLLRFVRHRSKS